MSMGPREWTEEIDGSSSFSVLRSRGLVDHSGTRFENFHTESLESTHQIGETKSWAETGSR